MNWQKSISSLISSWTFGWIHLVASTAHTFQSNRYRIFSCLTSIQYSPFVKPCNTFTGFQTGTIKQNCRNRSILITILVGSSRAFSSPIVQVLSRLTIWGCKRIKFSILSVVLGYSNVILLIKSHRWQLLQEADLCVFQILLWKLAIRTDDKICNFLNFYGLV